MQLELKSVKHSPSLSEETEAFTAILWIDGAPAAECKNAGRGGPTDIHFYDHETCKRFHAYAEALPAREAHGMTIPMDGEALVDDLLEAHLERKQLAGWCRTKIVFRLKDDKPGVYHTIKGKYTPLDKTRLQKQYGDKLETIVNETLATT